MRIPAYKDFADRVDVDLFVTAIDLEITDEKINKHNEREMLAQCPDPWGMHKHGDTTAKFAINADKRVYNCWVCGGGSLLSLVMAIYDMDVERATEWLLPIADDEAKSDDQWMTDIDRLLGSLNEQPVSDVLPYFNPRVLSKWDVHEELLRRWNDGDLDGKHKGIDMDVLHANGVRYAPDMLKYAPRAFAGDGKDALAENYEGPCVIFPHVVGERLVGWQHRWLSSVRPKWLQKYTNTPDFPKGSTLYRPFAEVGAHLPVAVVESVPTALYLASLGWPAVATFGAQATPEQLKLMRRFQQGVIVAPDNDKPGVEALVKMADYLDGFIPVSYVEPEGNVGDDLMDRGQWTDPIALLHHAIRLS